jgi:hypothetical protein
LLIKSVSFNFSIHSIVNGFTLGFSAEATVCLAVGVFFISFQLVVCLSPLSQIAGINHHANEKITHTESQEKCIPFQAFSYKYLS